MNPGKRIRLSRIMDEDSTRTLIVPMDHGVTSGAIQGLTDARETMKDMVAGGADALVLHKGLVRLGHPAGGGRAALIMHLSASTDLSPVCNSKALVGSVEEALRLGADAVSVHVNLGDIEERRMLVDIGKTAESCDSWGMPLLAMIYARAPHIKNAHAPEVVAHCARVGMELGADIVKVPYTDEAGAFTDVVKACGVPVVIAGGKRMSSDQEFLHMAADAIRAGASGLSVGRNVFQHPRRKVLLKALRGIVHGNKTVEEGLALLARPEPQISAA